MFQKIFYKIIKKVLTNEIKYAIILSETRERTIRHGEVEDEGRSFRKVSGFQVRSGVTRPEALMAIGSVRERQWLGGAQKSWFD